MTHDRATLIRAHLSPYVRALVRGRRRIRAAVKRARERGCTVASFVEFMDTVAPDWRRR